MKFHKFCSHKHESLKNNFINNHKYKTHDPALKIKEEYMRFAEGFSVFPKDCLSELNLETPIVTSE
jgi:hypothetical protein